jgi:hypothetical protein
VWFYYASGLGRYSDFDLLWYAAHVLLDGENPYVRLSDYRWPPYYPLPAYVFGVPFAPLPLLAARCAFAFLSAAAAAWVLVRARPWALVLVVSWPFVYAVQRGQWSPLILAACLAPALGFILAIKPTVGFAAFAYQPTRVAIAGTALLGVISLVILPRWPLDWLATIGANRHLRSPLLLPGGIVLSAALLRWRRPEARLLLILSAVPQTIVPYELVPLALIPQSAREILATALGWMLLFLWKVLAEPAALVRQSEVTSAYFPSQWWAMLLLGYLPALALVLRRPNHAT